MSHSIDRTKFSVVKYKDTVGIISARGNLFRVVGKDFEKDRDFRNTISNFSLPTEEETTLFLGSIFSNSKYARQFSSTFGIGSVADLEEQINISNHGLDVETSDQMEYKKFMVGINPDLTQGATA